MDIKEKLEIFRQKQEEKKKKKRQEIWENFKKKRAAGYRRYIRRKHKEMEAEKEKKKKEKEKEREKRKKEREKLKNKKKVGRPKKRGPHKKRKVVNKKPKVLKKRPTIDYKIVFSHNGKQNGYYNAYSKVEDAYNAVNDIIAEDKNVIFPKTINAGGKSSIEEILLLEKNRFGDKTNPLLRNEYGKLVEQKTNSKKWVILDKFPHKVEEKFWVYRYDPKTERKTFLWIYENIFKYMIEERGEVVRVILYLNKIIFKYDFSEMDIVFCKTVQEGIKFYNLLEEYSKRDKLSNIFFLGAYIKLTEKRRKLEDEIIEMTGWTKEQIRKRKTKKN